MKIQEDEFQTKVMFSVGFWFWDVVTWGVHKRCKKKLFFT